MPLRKEVLNTYTHVYTHSMMGGMSKGYWSQLKSFQWPKLEIYEQ